MHFEINKDNTLFVAVTGSHAYGTSTPQSDVDHRGVVRTPLSIKISTTQRFEQFQGDVPALRAGHTQPWQDCVIYDLVKAAGLIAQCNPNMVELLWIPQRCIVLADNRWDSLVEIRDSFLSTKAQHTYSGYAFAQWRKIASHRGWLLNPPKAPPTRKDYGLPEQSVLSADDRNRIEESIEGILRNWGIEDLVMDGAERDVLRSRMQDFYGTLLAQQRMSREDDEPDLRTIAGRSLGLSEQILEALKAERAYRAAIKHWASYQRHQSTRNEVRAELEKRFGYDCKHAMHLVRLLRMGTEVLSGKGVLVERPDAEELMAIRQGAFTYDQIDAIAKAENERLEAVAKTSTLPKTADIAAIDRAIRKIYGVD